MDRMTALSFGSVSYHYPDGTRGLGNCDLCVQTAERLALLGPNGAGKTTLLLLADGLLEPDEGSIEAFGVPLGEDGAVLRARQRMGIVFQNADDQVFCPTVFEDVIFGPLNHDLSPEEAHERAHEALKQVGLEGYENRVPQHLSGGEKRKVALATVLAMQPDLILFDEPTTGLDPRGRIELLDLLEESEQTLLIATHDFELALRVCTRVALMDKGRVVATGPPKEILMDRARLETHGLVQPPWLPYLAGVEPNTP